MELADVVRQRRMVRNFSDQSVSPGSLERILEIAQRGPSAGFTQGQDFVVITNRVDRKVIAEICGEKEYVKKGFDPFISRAPVLIVPCTSEANYRRRYREPDKMGEDGTEMGWPIPYWFMDVGCAVMLILLAAVDEGLAAGFAGIWDIDALKDYLSIPDEVTPMGVIPIGHPAPDKRSPSLKRGRRPKEEVIHREKW